MINFVPPSSNRWRNMMSARTFTRVAAGALSLAMGAGVGQRAVAQPSSTAIYAGGSPQSAGVTLAGSGSGVLTLDTTHVYAGGGSLKLVTQGLYQGGIIRLIKPYDLAPMLTNKNAYIQLAFMPPATATGPGAGPGAGSGGLGGKFGGGFPGASGGPGSGGPPGAGNPFGGSSAGGGQASGNKNSTRFQKAHELEHVRVVFVTTTGHAFELKLPVSYANDETGWKVIGIPVSAISGLSASDAMIKEVRVYGDTTGTMYIGKIGVVVDTTRLMIEPIPEKTVTANEKYRYTASAHGGASPLVYSWDWDDRDGIQDESQGRSASHLYRKPGDYKVTVTVLDPFGVKDPVSTKFNIHVP